MRVTSRRRFAQRARRLAEATPASRNRFADLIRVVSIGVVVIGHWTMAVIWWDGSFRGSNLLELEPELQASTWLFQVMPLFFIVGGFANAGSWVSARRRQTRYADWLRAKAARLLRPALVFVAFWTIGPMLAVFLGLSSGIARTAGREVALPLWFLAIYLLAVAAIPPLLTAHERFGGLPTLWVLAAAAVVIDVISFGLDAPAVGPANFAFVWLAVIELGFLWRDGTLTGSRWLPVVMAVGGLLALAALCGALDYPVSMIKLAHAERSNAFPPSVALLALAVWQCGFMLLLEDIGNRWLRRPGVWLAVVSANSMIMTLYLWNMSALVVASALLFPTGSMPTAEPLSPKWWILRPAWFLACGICLAPFVLGFRWAERPSSPPRAAHGGWVGSAQVVAGVLVAGSGMGILAARAFPVQGEEFLAPAIGIGCLVSGAALLGVRVRPAARGTTDPVPG